jgi:uncharacterized membrane protein
MARLKALWFKITDSLWFVPAMLTLTGATAAILLVRFNDSILGDLDPTTRWWAFGGSPEGASGVLSAIASSIITVTGVVFSVTIVALQLASSQFTPRVLRQFTSDRANQIVLGVFIGTFTYTLLVQRTIRSGNGEEFVPNLAVTGAVVLALLSIGFLIFFIDHAARSIQASVIIESVTTDTLHVIRRTFPERVHDDGIEEPLPTVEEHTAEREDAPLCIACRRAGYLQSIDTGALKKLAVRNDLLVRLDVEIGRYILPGDTVISVWPAAGLDDDVKAEMRDALVLGMERTPYQDLKLGIIELMDIAVKAMSPSVNDPTTALNAIDRLGEILHELAWRRRGDMIECDDGGAPRVLVPQARLEDAVGNAFDQIRHFAAGNPGVAIAMTRLLGRLAAMSPARARPVFVEHLEETVSSARALIVDAVDRQRYNEVVVEAQRLAAGEKATVDG